MRSLIALATTLALSASVPAAAAPTTEDDPVDRVLVISVDGLNPQAITTLGPKRAPGFYRLRRKGAGTANARTLYERTETLPNHTSMLTGRRIALPKGMNVTFNDDNGTTLAATAGHYVPGVFDVVHDNGGSTAMYVSKSKFTFLDRSWDATHGAPDVTGPDDGRDKVDNFVYDEAQESLLVDKLISQLRSAPATFTFLHLAAPDRLGHAYGGMGPEYLAAVQDMDKLLRRLFRTIRSVPQLREHMLVVLTADHGTRSTSHADPTKLVNYRIPFYAWGPGVKAGADLYALNPSFRSPGTRRPGYSGRQPIRNGAVANLVTDQLDLPVVPGSEINRARKLDLR